MSIQTVEISLPESIIKVIEIRQGPAGTGGGTNSVTSATTSDGTANLSLSNVTTATATVTGTLTADHIHGNLAGNVYSHIRAGEALSKGDPVYVSGSHGSGSTLIPIVSKADASNAAKMPAIGIMDAAVANNANGHMVIVGTITELNTAAYSVNAELYVASGGGFTATPPTARAQPVARVERANANNGAVIVKVNGLSASDATANTLVRRTSGGGASFQDVNAASVEAGTIESTTLLQATALEATGNAAFQGSVEFQTEDFTYGTGAAEAHRIALGGASDSSTGTALFGAATVAAARQTLEILTSTVATDSTATTQNVWFDSGASVALTTGTWQIRAFYHGSNAGSSRTNVRLSASANWTDTVSRRIGTLTGAATSAGPTYQSGGVSSASDFGALTPQAGEIVAIVKMTGSGTISLQMTNTNATGTVTCFAGSHIIATKL